MRPRRIYCTNIKNVIDQARENSFFHQDDPTALCTISGDRTIHHPLWPAHLPYLTIYDYFHGEPQKTIHTRTIKTQWKKTKKL